jgi:hypothetical protein
MPPCNNSDLQTDIISPEAAWFFGSDDTPLRFPASELDIVWEFVLILSALFIMPQNDSHATLS